MIRWFVGGAVAVAAVVTGVVILAKKGCFKAKKTVVKKLINLIYMDSEGVLRIFSKRRFAGAKSFRGSYYMIERTSQDGYENLPAHLPEGETRHLKAGGNDTCWAEFADNVQFDLGDVASPKEVKVSTWLPEDERRFATALAEALRDDDEEEDSEEEVVEKHTAPHSAKAS